MSDIAILDSVKAFLDRHHGHFYDGKAVAGASSTKIDVLNPATDEVISRVADATQEEIDAAVASSRRGFKAWGKISPAARGDLMLKLADVLQEHREELAQIETLQSGKIIQLSRAFEVDQSCAFLRYYAGWTTKIDGQTMSPSLPASDAAQYFAFTRREPVGVVAGIVPWNFSIMIALWKIGSALATGCVSIIKPSEFTPFTLLRVAELAIEAGIPEGVINVVNGSGRVGQSLIAHAGTDKVSFTGSVPTGIAVGQAALGAKLTRATLELGGKNAAGFLPDVDAERAVAGIFEAAFLNQGQICAAAESFYVHRSRLDEIVEKLAKQLSQVKIGSPLDESTQYGPAANKVHLEKLNGFFATARAEGNRIAYGGKSLDGPGCFVEPTIIIANSKDDTLLNQETFGPIATFLPYDTEEELVELMNRTPYGLSASIWTNDLSKAFRLIPKIEAGTVWVNMHTFLDPAVPFGGVKSSGIGREFGSEFINDYTEVKSVMIRY